MQTVVIIDFGGQYTQLIARRVRQAHVYSIVLPWDSGAEKIKEYNPIGIILSGGPATVVDDDAPYCDKAIFNLGIPVLGICYGMQLMAFLLDGKVEAPDKREYGSVGLNIENSCGIFKGLPKHTDCYMSHTWQVQKLPDGFAATANTDSCPIAAMAHKEKPLLGIQFHPEVTHTTLGQKIIENFLYEICQASGDWQMEKYAENAVNEIRKAVGEEGRVLLGLSGGVDSAVVAALIHRAIGDRLHCVFVDHGFMRQDEPKIVKTVFTVDFPVSLSCVDASDRFMNKLSGVSDPEQKRKIIGHEFVHVFKEEASKIGKLEHFAQGTIYPDVIESGAVPGSQVIKSHHNVGGLPKELGFTSLIEPLRMLFKDEVRELGRLLGLPASLTERQPFPGPGLAIRVMGELNTDKVKIVRLSDAILREEIDKSGISSSISQYFTILTGVQTVGVMGDERSYLQAICIRAVTTDDFMTADWATIPRELLAHISRRIVNEVPGVNRVLYDITTKPPASIEWE